ncbi:MAG: YcaQ family DNA glycosylase [Bacteroidetes bacterium]|nr:YcaQ family DNA glycosylase [Bacteroidota bacterium]
MKLHTLSPEEARKIIIHAAGLTKHGQFGKGPEAVFKVIDHLGFLQIDTNYVVERAHHHALASRIPGYKHEWLKQLQSDGRIFEFWNYASGFIPLRYFRYSFHLKQHFLNRHKSLSQPEINLMKKILNRISIEGPLIVGDFENDRVTKSSGWWDWRPAKIALERLNLDGRLMTTRSDAFHKVYDLPDNVVWGDFDKSEPTEEEFARHVIMRSLQAHGISMMKEMVFNTRFVKPPVKTEITKLLDEGKVCRVEIRGRKTPPLYMLPSYLKKNITLAGDAFVLSPFDTINFYRHRLRDFFNFDYQIECFVPEPKRKYGYFSLPILLGDRFVARMDSKADRKTGTLIIHNLHFEPTKLTEEQMHKVTEEIRAFAKFNRCNGLKVEKCNNKSVARYLNSEFKPGRR